MRNYIVQILVNAIAVFLIAKFLPGAGVEGFVTAVWVAFWLSVLNLLVKPILVILTLPITILTLGLFLLIVNAIIISIADSLIGGFYVNGIFVALIFSLLLSVVQSFLHSLFGLKED
ncbi:phage holin family protein [Wenyingzhuangia sp. 2_MG-2023]|uniref:phage holin family protein n=1 Tax=Wenyingzhuangia sp. 2_MG-2023 TaxID=3062639 RepID=UPI0026E24868|nr:phage holin family protein [Wenyingzhuangia sp. 2_MG-2023]MDO6736953.1 phage holin family protein [Wenyingzhuangia sp. 2_MG-2023]MDO6801877.1 phage holin family protein [Wenyingzhuangia sp. 1_MG-2023]